MMLTKKRLEILIDNSYRRPAVEELIDWHFFSSLDLSEDSNDGRLQAVPWWVWDGLVENTDPDWGEDDYRCELVDGYHDSKAARRNYHGQTTRGDIREWKGVFYEYIDSVALPQEVELISEDGGFVRAYRGASFLRIWQPVIP